MEKKQVLFQNVTPADFENLKADLTSAEYSVFPTSVDAFNALVVNAHAYYNRNQNTLAITVDYNPHYESVAEDVVTEVVKVTGKPDVSEKLQAKPVETVFDRQTGLVVPPPPVLTQEEQQVKNDADPIAPIERDVKPVPAVSVVDTPASPQPEKKEEAQPKKDEKPQESSKKK